MYFIDYHHISHALLHESFNAFANTMSQLNAHILMETNIIETYIDFTMQ